MVMVVCVLGVTDIVLFWLLTAEVNKVRFWRRKWIELEHDTARALMRQPRDITTVKDEAKNR